MKLLKISYLSYLCGSICSAINFKPLGHMTPIRRMTLSSFSNTSPPVPLQNIDTEVNKEKVDKIFVLPKWAMDKKGNLLFAEACAKGAIPTSLLFKSSAQKYIESTRQKDELTIKGMNCQLKYPPIRFI